jgi:hypothetical protein
VKWSLKILRLWLAALPDLPKGGEASLPLSIEIANVVSGRQSAHKGPECVCFYNRDRTEAEC